MRWSAAPKPMLLDSSFGAEGEAGDVTSRVVAQVAMRTTPVKERTIRNSEIFFDAADSRRFGKEPQLRVRCGPASPVLSSSLLQRTSSSRVRIPPTT